MARVSLSAETSTEEDADGAGRAIFEDEGTREGTRKVHDDIFLKKCNLIPSDASGRFTSRLWVTWGDQKTAAHIRSVQPAPQMLRNFLARESIGFPCPKRANSRGS